jgi:hypothetical protein
MCIFWPLSEGKRTSTGVRWLVTKSGVGAIARDKNREEGRTGES